MRITNILRESSFIMKDIETDSCRDELIDLNEILDFCLGNGESMFYHDSLLDVMIESGDTIMTCLGRCGTAGNALLLQLIQRMRKKDEIIEDEDDHHRIIYSSCGRNDSDAYDVKTYCYIRQDILMSISDSTEYGTFMRTCFPNIAFSSDCTATISKVKGFSNHSKAYTKCLQALNDEWLTLLEMSVNKQKEVLAYLKAKSGSADCAPDPSHKKDLEIVFIENNHRLVSQKTIKCDKHFKIARKNSDMRVYFGWPQKDFYDGKKVPVGGVGTHLY